MRPYLIILFLQLFRCSSCFASPDGGTPRTRYDFSKADTVLTLPDTLREISGLTVIDATTFACIQDENGILFIYDLVNNRIKNQFVFNLDGDYEGITRVGNTIYILRSDGVLFEIEDYQAGSFKLISYATGIPAENNEGLCYDADHHRLLIACKGKTGKGPVLKDKRLIYAFDLHTKKLVTQPVYQFNVQLIRQFADEHQINTAVKSKKRGRSAERFVKFSTSAICIHPFSKKLYLLSAADHLLFIFNPDGQIEQIEALDPVRFNKAEGITFFENGDMLITNEGQDKKPTLFRFNYND